MHGQYDRGLITQDERHETIVNIWTEVTDKVAEAMEVEPRRAEPRVHDGQLGRARVVRKQIRQLAGMRGLMGNPKGEIIERPIKANFMEGLSVLEYFISTHGARKGLADTALRTADSGYLTRRLVDVSQDVIVREEDCGTEEWVELPIRTSEGQNKSLLGRLVAKDLAQAARKRQVRQGNPRPDGRRRHERAARRARGRARRRRPRAGALGAQVPRRDRGVHDLLRASSSATGEMCEIGDAIFGIVAAQSIGEPGTQLTMRTFHHGGVAGADITTRPAARGRDLRGAQPRRGPGTLAEAGGRVEIEQTERGPKIAIHPTEVGKDGELADPVEYQLPRRTRLLVNERPAGRAGRRSQRGLAQPRRPAQAEGLDADGAVPRRRGAEGL